MKFNIKSEAAAGIVAGASFIASAGHIVTVVDETNHIAFALVYPIGIDGLLYVGIRAVQTGRKFAGILAILVGALFSLAFNADAENALTMPRLLIASSMPVCMVVAFVIEGTAKKAETIEKIVPATVPTQTEFDRMNERVETRLRAEHVLAIETMKSEFEQKFSALQNAEPVRVRATVEAPKAKAITSTPSAGRVASWDVEKTVGLIEDGRTDADVLAVVDGLTAKPLQRTKRVVKILSTDASIADEDVKAIVKDLSLAHIARVRAAMKENA